MTEPDVNALNVWGHALRTCSFVPLTGWFRDGCCRTDDNDGGRHLICARMTAEFLTFSRKQGNDLTTPRPEFQFPGLKPGDYWCVCALRWLEAEAAGYPPPIRLSATHAAVTRLVPLDRLLPFALDAASNSPVGKSTPPD